MVVRQKNFQTKEEKLISSHTHYVLCACRANLHNESRIWKKKWHNNGMEPERSLFPLVWTTFISDNSMEMFFKPFLPVI